jgi:hypothetical protein
MINPWTTKSPPVLSLVALSFAFLVSFGSLTEALAICSTAACNDGWGACVNWCESHNRTAKSQGICVDKCDAYWRDGASIGRPNPPNPSGPPRIITPVPPTTVGPPARKPGPVQPVKPVGVSNPNKTNGGPVILLREHNDSGGQGHRH